MTDKDVTLRLDEIVASIHAMENQIKALSGQMPIMESALSEKLSNRFNDALWRLMPMMVSIQVAFTGLLATALYWIAKS